MLSTLIHCFIFVLFSLTVRVKSQACDGMSQYGKCSKNSACACFHRAGTPSTSICTNRHAVTCSELAPCNRLTNNCSQPEHICVHDPQCRDIPVCYPVPSYNNQLCPPIATTTTTKIPIQQIFMPNIPANAKWNQNGVTVAGNGMQGSATNRMNNPGGLYVDDNQTVIIADTVNHRIIQWNKGDTNGQVVAGGNGQGNGFNLLSSPRDVLIEKETDTLIICDQGNRRVVQWSRRTGTTKGEILIDNIFCKGLAMDDQRYLYVSDMEKHEIKRYKLGDNIGIVVAGGNGKGVGVNQFNEAGYLFVDRQQTVYVSDENNHRIMKWNKGAKEGIVIAGGQGTGSALKQLFWPNGLIMDALGTLYIADRNNERVMRWSQGATQGTVVVGGHGRGTAANQFVGPVGLSFDQHGNLYVVDSLGSRVQRFSLV
ncbi:unnamed protein product [Rotaria socialis]